jgi:hypothetical protein
MVKAETIYFRVLRGERSAIDQGVERKTPEIWLTACGKKIGFGFASSVKQSRVVLNNWVREIVVQDDSKAKWAIARGETDGQTLIHRFRSKVPDIEFSEFPTMIVIKWEFESDHPQGFPVGEVNDRQNVLEDLMEWADDEKNSYMTHVVTANGSKEWLWYVKDTDQWMDSLNEAFSDEPQFPIQISLYNEPKWETFTDFIEGIKGAEHTEPED